MTPIQSHIRLHVGLATLDPIPQLAAQIGSTQLRLMTWHVGPTVLTCQLTVR